MAGQPEPSASLQAVRLLLDGISAHAVFDNSEQYIFLRREFQHLISQLTSEQDAFKVVRSALSMLMEHNRRVTGSVRIVRAALPQIVSRLTASLQSVREINETAVDRLQTVERQLAKASTAEDLESLRASIAALLDTARFESLKQSSLVSDAISQVIRDCRQVVEISAGYGAADAADDPAAKNIDSLTGLPNRARAEPAIIRLVKEEGAYVSVFHLNRLPLIQSRFGIRGRDESILQFIQRLAQLLAEPDTLFRWSETAFLGIVFDCVSTGHVVYKEDVTHFMRTQQIINLELGGRMAIVAIPCRHRQFSICGVTPSTVFQQIDAFVDGGVTAAAEAG